MANDKELRKKVVALLESYGDLRAKVNILRFELSHAAGISAEELIGQMALPGRKEESGIRSGAVSDKTMYIALSFQERLDQIKDDNFNSTYDLLAPLETYVRQLDYRLAEILRLYYFEGLTWRELEKRLGVSVKGLQNRRDQAVDKLTELFELSGKAP